MAASPLQTRRRESLFAPLAAIGVCFGFANFLVGPLLQAIAQAGVEVYFVIGLVLGSMTAQMGMLAMWCVLGNQALWIRITRQAGINVGSWLGSWWMLRSR